MSVLPLGNAELVQARAVANKFLQGTAVVLTQSLAADGQGGFTDTYVASGTVAARLAYERLRGGEAPAAGRLIEMGNWVLTVPAGTSVGETDRVRFDSVVYEVTEVLTMTPVEVSRRVRLKEID
jgi:hypothetical protein